MVEDKILVVSRRRCSKRSLLSYADRIDLCRMPTDLANSVPRVCGNTVTIALLTIAYCNNPLAVSVPSNIVDSTRNDGIFPLRQARAVW